MKGSDIIAAAGAKTGLGSTRGRWATNHSGLGLELGVEALAAVLRALARPAPPVEVLTVVAPVAHPWLLAPVLDANARAAWRTVIGPRNMRAASGASPPVPWAEALRRAVIEHVLTIDDAGLWRAGPDVGDAPSRELDARALVVVARCPPPP